MPRHKTTTAHARPPAMLRKRAVWLGLDLEAMAEAAAVTRDHVRAMLNGHSRVTEEFADLLLGMTLQAAADLRVGCAERRRSRARRFRPPEMPARAPARADRTPS